METAPEISQLITSLGLEKRCLYSDPSAEAKYIIRDGKPVPLPGSAPGFFATKLFSFKAKLRLMIEPLIGRAPEVACSRLVVPIK